MEPVGDERQHPRPARDDPMDTQDNLVAFLAVLALGIARGGISLSSAVEDRDRGETLSK
jgi:hypothetical protein